MSTPWGLLPFNERYFDKVEPYCLFNADKFQSNLPQANCIGYLVEYIFDDGIHIAEDGEIWFHK